MSVCLRTFNERQQVPLGRAGWPVATLGQCSDVGENCPGPDHSTEPVAKNEIGS